MVLLHLMRLLGYKPHVAHVNFKLRGKDSEGDAEFVKTYCKKNEIECHYTEVNTEEYAQEHKLSTQMAARELRYDFFDKIIAEQKLDYIATAHHADDSLETILLNLGRGTGLLGMGGIRNVTSKVLRPLHACTKEQILDYATATKIAWREDVSNSKETYQRNALRIKVVPELKKVFPSFDSSFAKSLQYLDEDRKLLEHLIQKELQAMVIPVEDNEKMSIQKLQSHPSKWAILRHWLQPFGSFDVQAIMQSLDGQSGLLFEHAGFRLLKDRDFLILQKIKHNTIQALIEEDDTFINEPLRLAMERKPKITFEPPEGTSVAALDFSLLEFPLTLRKWRPGDRFYPLGMKHSKKLSDYFIDKKYSRFDKEETWLLCSGENIVWIINDRIDDRFKITNKTKTIYFVSLL